MTRLKTMLAATRIKANDVVAPRQEIRSQDQFGDLMSIAEVVSGPEPRVRPAGALLL